MAAVPRQCLVQQRPLLRPSVPRSLPVVVSPWTQEGRDHQSGRSLSDGRRPSRLQGRGVGNASRAPGRPGRPHADPRGRNDAGNRPDAPGPVSDTARPRRPGDRRRAWHAAVRPRPAARSSLARSHRSSTARSSSPRSRAEIERPADRAARSRPRARDDCRRGCRRARVHRRPVVAERVRPRRDRRPRPTRWPPARSRADSACRADS